MPESDDQVAKRIKTKRKSIYEDNEHHERRNKERAKKSATVKSAYQAVKDSTVIKDLLEKAKAFQEYHAKIAQDGVGARKTGYKLENGQAEVENYFLSQAERV